MDSRLEYSLRCDTFGPGATVPTGQVSTAVGWTEQTILDLLTGISGSTATDIFTRNAHGLLNGDLVYFWGGTGGGPNINFGVNYYVIASTTNTFQLALTAGGVAIDITVANVSNGILVTPLTTVTHTLYMSPNRYGETWAVERVTVQNTSTLKVPTASVYRGVLSPSSLVDATQNGTYDVDDLNTPIVLNRGELVIIQFTGCQPPSYTGVMSSTVFTGGTVSYR